MLRIDDRQRRLVISGGGGGLLLFGLVFAGFGALFMFMILTGGDVTVNDRPARPADVWFPAIFVLIGLAIGFSRYRREIDLDRAQVRTNFSCLLPLYRRTEALGTLRQVSLRKEVRRSNNRNRTVYPVRLETEGKTYDLTASQDELRARREAEAVARVTGLDLADSSSGSELVRSPEELDRSVLERGEVDSEEIPEPAGSRIEIEKSIRESRIRVPVAGLFRFIRWVPLLALAFPFAFWWFALRPGMIEMELSDLIGRWFTYLPLVMFVAVPLLVIAWMVLRSDKWTQTLVVDRQGLRRLRPFGSLSIPTRELEELRIATAPACLLARSDRAQFRCGYGLSQDELAYLRQAILAGLRGD